jgi:hypothetical protein
MAVMNIQARRTTCVRLFAAAGVTAASLIAPVAALADGSGVALARSSAPDTQSSPCPGANLCITPETDPSVPYGTDPFGPYGPDPIGPSGNQAATKRPDVCRVCAR